MPLTSCILTIKPADCGGTIHHDSTVLTLYRQGAIVYVYGEFFYESRQGVFCTRKQRLPHLPLEFRPSMIHTSSHKVDGSVHWYNQKDADNTACLSGTDASDLCITGDGTLFINHPYNLGLIKIPALSLNRMPQSYFTDPNIPCSQDSYTFGYTTL